MQTLIKKYSIKYWKQWDLFWFQSDSFKRIKIFRFLFGFILFGFYFSRTFDLEFFYTDSGILRLDLLPDLTPTKYRFSIFYYVMSLTWVHVFHGIFLGALLTLALGIFPRVSAVVALFLHLSFIHRNMPIAYGVDTVGTFFLFCLCFSNSRGVKGSVSSALESMSLRLIQIQVCIIYAYAGFEKLRGVLWWKGEAVWYVVANTQVANFDFSWMSNFPILIVISTYSTMLWELYFPVLVWIKPVRRAVLVFGVLLHLGIAFTVSIPFFSLLMISTYILFLNSQDMDHWVMLSKIITIKLKSVGELPKRVLSRL